MYSTPFPEILHSRVTMDMLIHPNLVTIDGVQHNVKVSTDYHCGLFMHLFNELCENKKLSIDNWNSLNINCTIKYYVIPSPTLIVTSGYLHDCIYTHKIREDSLTKLINYANGFSELGVEINFQLQLPFIKDFFYDEDIIRLENNGELVIHNNRYTSGFRTASLWGINNINDSFYIPNEISEKYFGDLVEYHFRINSSPHKFYKTKTELINSFIENNSIRQLTNDELVANDLYFGDNADYLLTDVKYQTHSYIKVVNVTKIKSLSSRYRKGELLMLFDNRDERIDLIIKKELDKLWKEK